MATQTPHIVFLSISLPFTIPMLELARLTVRRGFTATLIVLSDVSNSHPQDQFLQSYNTDGISYELIPSLPLTGLTDDTPLEQRMALTAEHCAPFVSSILKKLVRLKRVVAFVTDPVASYVNVDSAKTLRIPSFMFFTSSTTALAYALALPELDNRVNCAYCELTEPLSVDGCVQLNGSDFFQGTMDRAGEGNKASIHIYSSYKSADGILINSFEELETEPCRALKQRARKGELPPVYAIGPVVPLDGWGEDTNGCLKWLDEQPNASVLYIALGTGGTLTRAQTAELAYGLEKSGYRFVWVVRHASNKDGSGAFFNLKLNQGSPLDCLPDGFVERTKGRGFFIELWAPQVQILKHSAVGGFLSICGWSSVVESLSFGVPLIAFPLAIEQKMNAVLLSESVGVALRVKTREDGTVSGDEVCNVVKELFEGSVGARAREKAKELQAAAKKAVDEGGTSYEELGKWCDGLVANNTTGLLQF